MKSKKYLMEMDNLEHLYIEKLQHIINSKDSFRDFLNVQAKLFKYNFEDTLLIYGQNPNATAVAVCEQWNKVGRRVHKGSVALRAFTDETHTEMKYIHDLSNTYGRAFTYPIIYTIPEKCQKPLIDRLNGDNGEKHDTDDFIKLFKLTIEQYVTDNYQAFYDNNSFQNDKSGSILETLDKQNTTEIFKETVVDCVGYMLCEKFGIPQGIYGNDELSFVHLDKFNDREVIAHLMHLIINFARAIGAMSTFQFFYDLLAKVTKTLIEKTFVQLDESNTSTIIDKLSTLAEGNIFVAIISVVVVVMFFVLYIKFLSLGAELFLMRLYLLIACVGLIDSDKGVFGPFVKEFFTVAATVVFQLTALKLSIMAMFQGQVIFAKPLKNPDFRNSKIRVFHNISADRLKFICVLKFSKKTVYYTVFTSDNFIILFIFAANAVK